VERVYTNPIASINLVKTTKLYALFSEPVLRGWRVRQCLTMITKLHTKIIAKGNEQIRIT
jgi:hypothetical protein